MAWIEAEPGERSSYLKRLSGAVPDAEESVRVETLEPQRVELGVELKSAGLVILADIYYPGWELTIDGIPSPIQRVNRAMRGAFVPAGSHKIVYVYKPRSLIIGFIFSFIGLSMTLALGLLGSRVGLSSLKMISQNSC